MIRTICQLILYSMFFILPCAAYENIVHATTNKPANFQANTIIMRKKMITT